MGGVERAAGRILRANNERMRRSATDSQAPNPRDPHRFPWVERLVDSWGDIRAEWDGFARAGGATPPPPRPTR